VKKQISITPVLAIGLVIVAAVVWFALVSPKQAKSGELDAKIEEVEAKLAVAGRAQPDPAAPEVEIEAADVFRLAKAMPDRDDMPGMILELNSIALSTGVRFVAIQPSTPVTRGAYHAIPVALTFEGNYYDLTDFLFRMRNLVSVRDGVLAASGRLYTLDAIQFNEGAKGFPNIQAILTISAYAYGAAPTDAAAPAAAPTDTTATGTTGTTGTGTTTQPTTTEGPPADPTGDGNPQAAAGGTG
jgi:Tfp pilus assembly protein PilO